MMMMMIMMNLDILLDEIQFKTFVVNFILSTDFAYYLGNMNNSFYATSPFIVHTHITNNMHDFSTNKH